ncbi:alpha/beta fold hydrolase [Nakamurella deserti]|uniref:alpha/beta fold hydrolase n=1 Tax=Nakamurella deserti TaxID=2164074 RepID=UPI00197B7E32|nr:alpha/beta hydrolase [Nakamurella deserti]
MYVVEDGPRDGPPILLVHGFASSSHAFDRLVEALPDRRVIRVDLLGHGRTGGGAADATVQADALAAVLHDRDLHEVTAVGHSYGADVVLALAAVSDRVRRTVILAQGPDYAGTPVPRVGFLTDRPALTRRLHTALRPALGTLARRPWKPVVRQGLDDLKATDPAMLRVVLADRRATLAATPLDAQLSALGRPALVVLGGRDRLYGARAADRYRAAGARVEVIAASGHAMPQEHPAEVAALLRGFAI